MGMQQTSRWCGYCGRHVLATRPGTNHVLHLLLTLVTCGWWSIVWLLVSVKIGGWRCSVCGRRPQAGLGQTLAAAGFVVAVVAVVLVLGLAFVAAIDRTNRSRSGLTPLPATSQPTTATLPAAPPASRPSAGAWWETPAAAPRR